MYRRATKILLIGFIFFIMPQIAQAGFLDDMAYCTWDGSCNLTDIARAFSSLIKLLLGGIGAVALIYFVWGGIQWLVSGGNAEKVKRGNDIMINTVFALILAFGSYLIITFFVNDVLNVKEDSRIEEGQFTSCQDAVVGSACGEARQCTGEVTGDYADWSYKCLYACQVQTLDYPRVAECVISPSPPQILDPARWQIIDAPNLCSGDRTCAVPLF